MVLLRIINNYSGLFALFVYLLLLMIIMKYKRNNKTDKKEDVVINREYKALDINDEDAVVASLIASIECRNEYHKNVRVVSVREIG